MQSGADPESGLRDQAIASLKRKRDFRGQLATYLAVNVLLVVIWAATSDGDTFFWPIFVILGWGIGVAGSAWAIYRRKPISESEITREAERLRR